MIPFIDLSRTVRLVSDSVHESWKEALDQCEFVGGASVAKLEAVLVNQLNVESAYTCANGTDAIILALQAAGVKSGMHVGLPDLTFWATYEAVVQINAIPVLIDVTLADLQMSYAELQKTQTACKLDAVILPHLYGWCSADLVKIRNFCKKNEIVLIEDGAQSFGVLHLNKPVYTDAEMSTLSFYPAKVIGGAMDGGAVCGRKDWVQTARVLGNHGRKNHYSYSHVGWNSRMGGIQARFLLEILKHQDAILNSRREAAAYYRAEIKEWNCSKIHVFSPPSDVIENGYLNSVIVDGISGDEIQSQMKELGVVCGRTYPEPISVQTPAIGAKSFSNLETSTYVCKNIVNLPLFAFITRDEQDQVLKAFRRVIS